MMSTAFKFFLCVLKNQAILIEWTYFGIILFTKCTVLNKQVLSFKWMINAIIYIHKEFFRIRLWLWLTKCLGAIWCNIMGNVAGTICKQYVVSFLLTSTVNDLRFAFTGILSTSRNRWCQQQCQIYLLSHLFFH